MNLLFLKEKISAIVVLTVISVVIPAESFSVSIPERDLSIGAIPKKLLENANAVVRYDDVTLEIKSSSSAVLKESFAITVIGEAGIDEAMLLLFYDKFRSIRKLNGAVYDKNGLRVKKMKKEDFQDRSAIEGFSTYEDHRMITCRPGYRTVPFTVEYSYETEFNGILNLPGFQLMGNYNVSLEQATLVITVPETVGVRYLEQRIREKGSEKKENGIATMSWNFKDYSAIRQEPLSPPFLRISPMVLIAPQLFELKNRAGNSDSWESLGKWEYNLIRDRDMLSEETSAKIRTLAASASDERGKIALIYQYLQDHTRYASIQIGLGGWQPELASEVDRLGYGDCKALTNYMRALLKAAGINAFYTVVYAGKDKPDIITSFPSNQFNHVILCVPMKTDSIWLECTSQHSAPGYLGNFTDDRTALLLSEAGGFLCHTPVYDQHVNFQSRTARVRFLENGDAEVATATSNQGAFYDEMVPLLLSDRETQRHEITNRIKIHSFNLEKFLLSEQRTEFPVITETVELTVLQTLTAVGDGYLFNPNLYMRENNAENSLFDRVQPVYVRRSMTTSDTTRFEIPPGFSISGAPFDEHFNSRFGTYNASAVVTGNVLQYVRTLVTNKGEWDPDEYEDYLSFFDKIAEADGRKLAFKK